MYFEDLEFVLRKGERMYSYTPVFKNNTTVITVENMLDSIKYMEEKIKKFYQDYKSALKILEALRLFFNNKKLPKIRKDEIKVLIDVTEKIQKMTAQNENEKRNIEIMAIFCKKMVENLYN